VHAVSVQLLDCGPLSLSRLGALCPREQVINRLRNLGAALRRLGELDYHLASLRFVYVKEGPNKPQSLRIGGLVHSTRHPAKKKAA
jgi:hypothetical protein